MFPMTNSKSAFTKFGRKTLYEISKISIEAILLNGKVRIEAILSKW
jgi:hypothetical protein